MALDCYNRMNYNFQGRHPPPQLAAMVATQNTQYINTHQSSQYTSSPWLADSGCNAHVTSDLSNLAISNEYNGEENIVVGNGTSLPISHTGSGTRPYSPSSSFKLSNLLCVPHIFTNLLSVHQLYIDNNCTILFDSDKFVIQDKLTGNTLFQGPSVNGLYPLTPCFTKAHSSVSLKGSTTAHVGIKSSATLWHNWLGHPHLQTLNSVFRHMNISTITNFPSVYEYCLYGKMHKLSFSPSQTIYSHPLQLIHSDV